MAKVQKIAYNSSTRERKNACVSLYVDAVRPNSLFGGFQVVQQHVGDQHRHHASANQIPTFILCRGTKLVNKVLLLPHMS